MKSKMFKKLMAAVLATTMTASLAACGPAAGSGDSSQASGQGGQGGQNPSGADASNSGDQSDQDQESEFGAPLTDENGNVYDLGGMEIVIRDWWSPETPAEPTNDYEEKTEEYREWIQETYNFKIKQVAVSEWGGVPQDFTDYFNGGGDDNNYVFILRTDPSLVTQMESGMMYDLATLDCLDFSEKKFQDNKLHELYSRGDKIYAMYSGRSEPRTGVYFNKKLLDEAGINPEDLYNWQASGEWNWAKFEELCAKVQRDTDQDGVIDVYACNCNNSMFLNMAVFSNGGEYVGRDADGKYVYKLEDAKTVRGLEWAKQIFDTYWQVEPVNEETGEPAPWDYYKNAFLNGEYVFMFEDAYCAQNQGWVSAMEDDFGFVMFPKGESLDKYIMKTDNNPAVIPGCYDADRAWKIAFAWNLYTNDTPGYEDTDSWKASYYNGFRDLRAVDETLAMMREPDASVNAFHNVIPSLNEGPDFTWNIGPGSDPVSTAVENIADTWKSYVDAANAKLQ